MPNFITNTAIVNESWNARGLITHNAVTKALVRADDSTLWAAVREGHVKEYINIYRSSDNGFSWENMYAGDFLNVNRRTGLSGLNQNGPFMHLTLSEERDRLILWHSLFNVANSQYEVEPYIFEITDEGLSRKTETADHAVTGIATNHDQLAFDVSYTTTHIYLTYASFSALKVAVFDHTYQTSTDGEGSLGSTYFNTLASHANDNNTLDIAIVRDDSPDYTLQYIRWTRIGNAFSTPVNISVFPAADLADMNIERDGQNNLLVFWNQESAAGSEITQKYAISTDNGVTWTVADVPFTPGQTSFTDTATGRLAGRTVALGGLQGFLLGYVRLLNGVATSFIRTLLWNGSAYVLGDEKVAVDETTTGFRFFRPTGNQLLDLDQLGEIRIAYQIGAATSQVQTDSQAVIFGQQLLREAVAFEEPEATYNTETPEAGQILISFNLLGATDENIDYYAEGLTGTLTNKYIGAFKKTGTVLTFWRYEPTAAAETSDRSAYGDPVTHISRAVIQPINYDFPVPQGNESFTTYIERDARKIHLPPTFHLARVFLVNAGNHLKRTVWIFRFDGNEYEISQVVPRFLRDQIAFYEANAYVVGPSNDPFSRVILPSET